MAKVRKTTITVTVLHPVEDNPSECELDAVLREMDNGTWIGTHRTTSVEDVPDANVGVELLAVGNDGHFFDFELGGEGDDEEGGAAPGGADEMGEITDERSGC